MIFLSIMLLILVAVFSDGHLDADAYVVPSDQCDSLTQDAASAWEAKDQDIVAVGAICEEQEDPREKLKEYHEIHPDVDKQKTHIPQDDET